MASVSGGALSGAGQGASAGSVAGPWGAVIGAGVGAVAGGIGANQANKDAANTAKKLKALQDQANKDNAQRYGDALQLSDQHLIDTQGLLNNQYSQIYGMQDQIGLNAPLERNRMQTEAAKGASDQGLISRGLYNSTIGNNAQAAIGKAGDRGAEDIINRNLQQSIGQHQTYTGLALGNLDRSEGQKYQTITNRSDVGPNLNAYGSLLSQPTSNVGTDALGAIGSFANTYSALRGSPQPPADTTESLRAAGVKAGGIPRMNADGSYAIGK